MGDQTIDFVNRFHALDGDAIGDRKKSFNKLLCDPHFSTNIQLIHHALDNLKPKTYLESRFKVDALIHFKHTARLLIIIKGGNEVFISKILKQHWFFEEISYTMDADSLVNDFLPCLSFVKRLKAMKKLALMSTEKKVDEIFTCLRKRYGLWVATKILHYCSKNMIESILENEEVNLRVNQVQHLFNRNDGLLEAYLDYYIKTFDNVYNESKISEYIAKKNPVLLLQLINENKIVASRLGRRTTKKVFGIFEDSVRNDIKEYEKYSRLLNGKVFLKLVGNDFKNIYALAFPKKVEDIYPYSSSLLMLKYYPKNKRWSLFAETFLEKIAETNINEVFHHLGEKIMELCPPNNVVIDWAEHNYQKTNDETYLKYLHTSKSIPLLKEKISFTSDSRKRSILVNLLLETCSQNDDLTALEEVLKYFCTRHRKENVCFRKDFLTNIGRKFQWKLNKFNATHWKYINEQSKLLKSDNKCHWNIIFLKRQLEFFFENGEDYSDVLLNFINCYDRHSFRLDLENPETERKILIEILTAFPDVIETGEEKIHRKACTILMESINTFCEKYPEHFIDLGEWEYFKTFFTDQLRYCSQKKFYVLKLIAKVLTWKLKFPQMTLLELDNNTLKIIVECCQHYGFNSLSDFLKKCLMKENRSDFENQLMLSYFDVIIKDFPDADIINWFIKYDPKIVIKSFSDSDLCKQNLKFNVKVIKVLSHLGLDIQLKSALLSLLETEDIDEYLRTATALRDLLSTDEFVAIINDKFVPTKAKLDLEDEHMSKLYDLICQIAKQLHKVEEPFKILSLVLKFSVGDYFQSALPSLQGIFYKSPEKELDRYVKELSAKAVSVRKHAVFLSCELTDQEHVINVLTNTEETKVSSQKHLFTATLKYFRKNPSADLLDLLIKNMSTIDRHDTETLDKLTETVVPKKYRGVYIEKCWGFYESLQNNGALAFKYFENLLKMVAKHKEILTSVPTSFIENLINKYYFENLTRCIMGQFVLKYLNHKGFREEKLLVCLMQRLVKLNKKELQSFIDDLRTCPNKENNFMISFSTQWNRYFTLSNNFEEHIMVELFLMESANPTIKSLAENIISYFDKIISEYSLNTLPLLSVVLNDFTSFKEGKEKFELLNEMLNVKACSYCCILVLSVINPISDEELDEFEFYSNIIEKIKTVRDPIVGIYLKNVLSY